MSSIAAKILQKISPPSRPGLVFVRGHPRSGTNWVGRLLNLHPQVFVTGEFHLEAIYHASEASKTYPWQLMHTDPVRSELTAAVQDVVRRCIAVGCEAQRPRPPVEEGKRPPSLPPLKWHGDRTPRDLLDWMPGERYIWILRDGRDVMVSWTFHQLRMGEEVIGRSSLPPAVQGHLLELSSLLHADPELFKKHPERLLACEEWVRRTAHTWNHRFQTDSENAARMQTDETPSRVLCLRYEALREHTERERQRMYEFLDLDPSLAHSVSREHYTAPGFEAENTLSFTRKGEVGDWRNYFTDEAKAWFNDIAGESLVRAGYARDAEWSEDLERETPVVTATPAVAAIHGSYSHETGEHTHTR